MATGDLLANSDGLALPQRIKRSSGYSPSSGDTTNFEPADNEVFLEDGNTGFVGRVGRDIIRVETSFTRPADTNQYTAGDVVSDSTSSPSIMTFSQVAVGNNEPGIIRKVIFVGDESAQTNSHFYLFLFNDSVTAQNDNAEFSFSYTDRTKLISVIALNPVSIGGSDQIDVVDVEIPFVCAGGADDIYGILVADADYTPTSGENFSVSLVIEQA